MIYIVSSRKSELYRAPISKNQKNEKPTELNELMYVKAGVKALAYNPGTREVEIKSRSYLATADLISN